MTDIYYDGKLLAKLEIITQGADAESFFLRGTTVDGKRFESGIAGGRY
jgi:hypothetical protein